MQHTILQSTESTVRSEEGITSGVAYDTAWTARVMDQSGNSLFPECVKWILENQKPDGSWGSQVLNYHDRIISTLSAVIALRELNGRRYESYIQKGESYLWENIKNLKEDSYRLIGSELLLPSLMRQAESMGLDLPYHLKVYQEEYNKKLERVRESLWYSSFTPLSFSLEFLGDNVNIERLADIQLPNGSVTTSPAATAFFLKHRKDARAFMYLRKILQITGDGSVMTVYPIEVFEYGWTIYNLMLAGLYFERYAEICNFLFKHLENSGHLCWSTESPIASADETTVVCKILYDMHYPVDFRVLEKYYTGDYFLTLESELDPSVSTNIHMLDFIETCREYPNRSEVVEKLLQFLRREMNSAGFWMDKWHISPYYPTSHAIIALCDADPSLAEKAVSWILESQNTRGTWGTTLEETAYAVQALMYYHQNVEPIDLKGVSRAMLALNVDDVTSLSSNLPDLWIGKVSYTPIRVLWSSMVSAQFMARSAGLKTSVSVSRKW